MDLLSIIIPAHNNAAVIHRTLASVEAALSCFRQQNGPCRYLPAEVVVVDDGSTDGTWEAIRAIAGDKDHYQLIRRPEASSASCARNVGAAAARGSLLFFLDGDDLFFPDHLVVCYRALQNAGTDFVKTGMHMADPVHPDWKRAIENSSVINLCVRRHCHFAFGGFPDYHLFVRHDEHFEHVTDIFQRMCEDIFYNRLLKGLFRGCRVEQDTVEYVRYPGNGYDRQYAKFCQPYGAHEEVLPEEERFRMRLGELIVQHHLHTLQRNGRQAAA